MEKHRAMSQSRAGSHSGRRILFASTGRWFSSGRESKQRCLRKANSFYHRAVVVCQGKKEHFGQYQGTFGAENLGCSKDDAALLNRRLAKRRNTAKSFEN